MDEMEKKLRSHAQNVKTHIIAPVNIKSEALIEMKKAKKMTVNFVLVAAFITLLSATVLAAVFRWDERLLNFLYPTEKQMQELETALNTPLATVSQNGVTIEIKQTLADSHGIYILYEMTTPEWFTLNDDIQFGDNFFHVGVSGAHATSGSSEKILEQSDNKRTALIYYSTSGIIENQKLTLELSDLGYYSDYTFEFNTLLEGNWVLEWDLYYVDTNTKTIEVNKKVDINGTNNNVITKVYISPMSVLINIEGDDVWTAFQPVINFKNGDEVKIKAVNDFNTSYSYHTLIDKSTYNDDGTINTSYGEYVISQRFDRITDILEIESIIIGDVVIPME